ncbi:hypothetical protein [Oligoflexus tunisiensis]|uniref:hypothetical protein n=1 Tax=Oligoflexus tunisiensis TaxID=708132 RepID=UPI00159F23CA|nr:hypothetical protein [Oligoflexus tunisiensis]
MSLNTIHLKLALVLSLTTLAPLACNNQKTPEELEEEENSSETFTDGNMNRDNREGQSGDAAFIKIYPDGEVVPTKGANTTVSAPASTSAEGTGTATGSTSGDSSTGLPSDASSPATPTESDPWPTADQPAPSAPIDPQTPEPTPPIDEETTNPAPSDPTTSIPVEEIPAPEPLPPVVSEPAPTQPAPEPVVVNEPAPAPAPGGNSKLILDPSRPILEVNEYTTASIIAVMPKANLSIVSIGKHNQFVPGPYAIMAKWTTSSKKVKVKVNHGHDKDCAIDESEANSEWKTLGIFYLTKNAKVMITNTAYSNYNVQNDFILKPVIAEKLTKPSIFTCLGGQVLGHGLKEFQ